jgi:predicted nucleic acid-binding protein
MSLVIAASFGKMPTTSVRQRSFIDTNVLLYAYDPMAKAKHEAAGELLRRVWVEGTGGLSTQARILGEYHVVYRPAASAACQSASKSLSRAGIYAGEGRVRRRS